MWSFKQCVNIRKKGRIWKQFFSALSIPHYLVELKACFTSSSTKTTAPGDCVPQLVSSFGLPAQRGLCNFPTWEKTSVVKHSWTRWVAGPAYTWILEYFAANTMRSWCSFFLSWTILSFLVSLQWMVSIPYYLPSTFSYRWQRLLESNGQAKETEKFLPSSLPSWNRIIEPYLRPPFNVTYVSVLIACLFHGGIPSLLSCNVGI